MHLIAVVLTITLASSCLSSPAEMPVKEDKSVEKPNKILDAEDTELEEAIRSLNMAANLLKDDPTYLNLERDLEQAIQDSNEHAHMVDDQPGISESFGSSGPAGPADLLHLMKEADPGIEIEYDTTKLIMKNKAPQQQHNNKKIIIKHYNQMPLASLLASQDPAQDINIGQQIKENMFTQQKHEDERQEHEKQMSEENNSFVPSQPLPANCDIKCEDNLTPVCAINVHSKYAIFENYCDMKVTNCLNPDLDWQPLPREMCTEALHGFYMRLHRYFSENNKPEPAENIIRK